MGVDVKRMSAAICACVLLLACGGFPALADVVIDLGRGPITVHVPSSYDPEVPAPLVVLLHGYSGSGAWQESYFQFLPLAEEYGFLYLHPDGTTDQSGNRFWNATDACCNFYGSDVDDSGYLLALVDEVEFQLNVDPRRVFFAGHSNGGFMSYRMACDHPETIAAIASLAGATFFDPADCSPAAPVHVLQIHGSSDTVIQYNGGVLFGTPYPGAVASVEQWAEFGGCAGEGVPAPPLDLDAGIPGDETEVLRYATGCAPDGSGELWTIVGGSHVPPLSADFGRLVVEYLLAHPKSEPTAVDPGSPAAAAGPALLPAVPNPFNPRTQLAFRLPAATRVTLSVHDLAGRALKTLLNGAERGAGEHRLMWDGRGDDGVPLASGIYLLRLEAGGRGAGRKLVLIR